MKLPSIQFYPGDWRKDPGIQSLDFELRGIWFEMLLLMFESAPRGYLTLNEKPMDAKILSKFIQKTPKKTEKILEILIQRGVAKKKKDGTIYNARMVRDEETRQARTKNGALGGKAKEGENAKQNASKTQANVKQNLPPSSSSSSSTSSSKEKNIYKKDLEKNFEEDWGSYPRKDGNKKKAFACYEKTVGLDKAQREAFLNKMKLYVNSVKEPKYLKHAETFFRNWQDLEVGSSSEELSDIVKNWNNDD